MKVVLLALGVAGLLGRQAMAVAGPPTGALLDSKDRRAVLVGPTTRAAILAHRAVFRENLAKVRLTDGLRARWKAIHQPLTLVAVFGSWCGDSHRQLPGLLALAADPNPFIEVHYLGVSRDKTLEAEAWPGDCRPQAVDLVPTFYLFALRPGGGLKLVGSIEETPPKAGQTMAEALVELVEAQGRTP